MTGRGCPSCGWAVPAFVPDYLVMTALGDHKAYDCLGDARTGAGAGLPEPAGSDGSPAAGVSLPESTEGAP